MKAITQLAILLLCVLFVSCRSKKLAVSTTTNVPSVTHVTAKTGLSLSSKDKNVSIGGMLRMKRDDVIQLSLVTFGILEVARIEMTPDYFMVMDKVNRQYVKASYNDVPFLKDANVDFRTIQTYFWDEQSSSHAAWERTDYVSLEGMSFPTKHLITVRSGSNTVKAILSLSSLKTDSDWETRTQIPARYTEMPVEKLMSHLLKLSL